MNKELFLIKFQESLIEDNLSAVTFETEFRKLETWDSLSAMAVITTLEDEFAISIDQTVFKSLNKVGEVYEYVYKLEQEKQ